MVEGRGIGRIGFDNLEMLKLRLELTSSDLHLTKLSSIAMVIKLNGYGQMVPSSPVEFEQPYLRIPSLPPKN